MINRQKFAAAAENKYKSVVYKNCDCQAFVEACAKEAGYTFNARGTNDMWRNYMSAKGNTDSFPLDIGDVVFKWREESSKLPERYKGDGIGDIYHVGVITALNPPTVCHSANSKENGKKDTYKDIAELAKKWSKCGTLKNTEEETTINHNTVIEYLLENDRALNAHLTEWAKNYQYAHEWYLNEYQKR